MLGGTASHRREGSSQSLNHVTCDKGRWERGLSGPVAFRSGPLGLHHVHGSSTWVLVKCRLRFCRSEGPDSACLTTPQVLPPQFLQYTLNNEAQGRCFRAAHSSPKQAVLSSRKEVTSLVHTKLFCLGRKTQFGLVSTLLCYQPMSSDKEKASRR